MNIKKIQRNKNIINDKEDLEYLNKFTNFPVFMGCTNQPLENDILFDMQWEISRSSGIIQLNPLLPLEVLYPENHGSGNIGKLWEEHHKLFAKFIKRQNPKTILEIGGLHGILCKEYKKQNPIEWTIVEPNPSPVDGVNATFIKCFFNDQFKFDGEVDTIVHSHVFEHVYHPNQFITHISNFLKEGQKLIFSIPNMEEMLKNKYTNCINFEHTLFLSEPYINYLMSKNGFKQIDKEYFKEDHSIFYSFEKKNKIVPIDLPEGLYEHNKNLYNKFNEYYKNLINELNDKIKKVNKDNIIYLFGAHIFSQYLIGFGLDTNKIVSLLDNDPNKQGKRLYGTNLKVESPKILKNIDRPIIILKAGVYNDEIRNDIIKNINSNADFWE